MVTGRAAVEQRINQVRHAARYERRTLEKAPHIAFDPPPVGQVASRTLYEAGSFPATGTAEPSDDPNPVRVLSTLPVRLYIADDRLALLLLDNAPEPLSSAVVLHPCGMFDALTLLFETLWARAVPAQPTAASEHLVTLLLSGLTDDAIARQLGIGERTVQRQIAGLLWTLGATTRFQAGAQAALRTLRSETP